MGYVSLGRGAAYGVGVRVLLILKLPLPSIRTKRTQTNSSVGGWGWERTDSPNPGGMPKYTRQEQGSLHIGQWKGSLKERYSNTKATVEHNTIGKGG